jgi:hypothetical protein
VCIQGLTAVMSVVKLVTSVCTHATGSAKMLGREDVGKEPSDYVSLDTVRRMLSSGDKSKCDLCEAPTTSKEERQTLSVCGHSLCVTCWQDHCKHYMTCPVCGTVLGIVKGPQPHGSMTQAIDNSVRIPGYSDVMGAIVVTYSVPAGEQKARKITCSNLI